MAIRCYGEICEEGKHMIRLLAHTQDVKPVIQRSNQSAEEIDLQREILITYIRSLYT